MTDATLVRSAAPNSTRHAARDAAAPATRRTQGPWEVRLRDVLGHRPLRVLEVGCRDPALALLLHDMGHTVVATDTDAATVNALRGHAAARGARIGADVAPADELSYGARSFDAVVARDPLGQPTAGLFEWYRVLRRGGIAVCVQTGRDRGRPADWLSCAGFVHVRETTDTLPLHVDGDAHAPWYRRWLPGRVPARVAWGRRP